MNDLDVDLIESLKTMGLTEYEAKVYSALVLFDRTRVKQIYEYLNIPKPSVYQSLKKLSEKGLVQVVNAKPAIYRATSPEVAIKHMSEIYESAEKKALSALEELKIKSVQKEKPDVIWTLFGEENVEHSLEDLIGKAEKSLKLVLPRDYLDYLELVRKKDVKIDLLIFERDTSIPQHYGLKNTTLHDASNLDLSDFGVLSNYIKALPLPFEQFSKLILIVVDDDEFMYIPPIPGKVPSGITSQNIFTIKFVSLLFDMIYEHTPEIMVKK
jgi:sugar-specific transcriptional regulator TrmB